MLSKEEMIDVLNFFNEAHRKVDGKDFDAALNVVDRFTEDLPNKNVSNREYLAFLIEHIRWLREELDKTQEGKLEFDNRAKKVVTSINRLLLTIAHLVGRLNLEKSIEDSYFAKINGEFSPIFTHIPEEREGFASFLKIDPDMRYYRDVYSQMISDFDKDLAKFIEWKKKYEEELKKKYGVLKDG